jgi:hypothetical protein
MNGSGGAGVERPSAIFEKIYFYYFFLSASKISLVIWMGSGHQWIEDMDNNFPNEWESLFCLPLFQDESVPL